MSNQGRRLVLLALNMPDKLLNDLNERFGDSFEFARSATKDEALKVAESAEVIAMIVPSRDIIRSATNCRWLHAFTAGVEDFLAIDEVKNSKQITLTNSSGIHAIPIAEHVFAIVLAFTRGIRTVVEYQLDRKWIPFKPTGRSIEVGELYGRTMGIAGLGSIGLEIAKKAKCFGMQTVAIRRDPTKELKRPEYKIYVDEIYATEEMDKALAKSDVLVNALPLTRDTTALFNAKLFSKIKRGSLFINIGRGKTVVEKDLIEALKSGQLSAAGLDVFESEPLPEDSPLWTMKNVIVSPHIAGWTQAYYERAYSIFIDNLQRYSKGEPLRNVVNKGAGY